jgi:hypothetical protein
MSVWGINVGAALTHVGVGKSSRCGLNPCRCGESRTDLILYYFPLLEVGEAYQIARGKSVRLMSFSKYTAIQLVGLRIKQSFCTATLDVLPEA